MKSLFKNSTFRFFLTLSLSLHIGLAFLVVLFSGSFLFQSKESLMIESAVQVDQINLDDLKKISSSAGKKSQTLPSLPKAPTKKKPLKPKKEKTLKLEKKSQNKETQKKEERKKDQTQPDQTQPDQTENNLDENSQNKESPKESANAAVSNETLDSKSSDDSQLSSEQISEISYYANQILRQIRRNWNLPSYLTNKALTTQVEIKINSEGMLIYKQIIQSSGDELYDSFVLKMIEKGTYPRPYPSIQKIIQKGVVLNVPSQ